ncbi:negative regulation of membrane protein ectodomain proteolysis [Mactra antiquata]
MLKLAILLTLFGTSWACSCFPMSNDKKFCEADFVMKIKVKSDLIIPGGRNAQNFDAYYRIRAGRRPWKMLTTNTPIKLRRLYTGSNSALCGVTSLRKGTMYLIAGNINPSSGRLQINSCSSFVRTKPFQSYRYWKRNPPNCDNVSSSTTTPNFFFG